MSKCEQCIVREFSTLKALTKEELLHMADCKTSRVVKKGEVIFEEGENINGVFCIKDGVCKLTKLSENGKSQIIKLVKHGELLGQRSVISEEPANLSAVALEDMQVCFIPKSEVISFFNTNNKFSMNMMRTICGDLRDADNVLVNMAQKTVRERLADALVYLHTNFELNPDGSLRPHLSREELAGIIGTATESCIRLLSEMAKDDLIRLDGKRIFITNLPALKRMSTT